MKRNGGEGERVGFGQVEEERVVLCEIEEGMRGLYRSGEGFRVWPFKVGCGREKYFEFEGRWGLWGREDGCEW